MLNSITLLGRLTKDPELRKSNEDVAYCTISLAFDNPNKESNGERGTTFIDVRCFKSVAESVCQHTHKGSKVAVTGSLTSRSYLNQAGDKRVVYEIHASSVEFLDPKPADNSAVEEVSEEVNLDDFSDNDLPFKEEEAKAKKPEAKFDPYTGKPLKPNSKK